MEKLAINYGSHILARVDFQSLKRILNIFSLRVNCSILFLLICANAHSQITSPVVYGTPLTISGGGPYTLTSLVVQNGGIASFSNCTILITKNTSVADEIEVQEGGYLTFTNCTLKVNTGSPYWYGIKVAGNYLYEQFSAYPLDPSYRYYTTSGVLNVGRFKQSYLELDNCLLSDMSFGTESTGGGVLNLHNSKFKDNYTSVNIQDYVNPSSSQPNGMYYNACQITDCNFEWTVAPGFGVNNWSSYLFINLSNIKGAHIQGCSFKNLVSNNATTVDCGDRGVAIQSTEASYSVHKSGTASTNADGCTVYNGTICSFEGTSYGMQTNDVTTDNSVAVTQATFDKNFIAISIANGSRHTISNNTFTSANSTTYPPCSTCVENLRFIYLDNAENSVIYNNTFTHNRITVSTSVTGQNLIEVNAIGSKNTLIYLNTFSMVGGNLSTYTKTLNGIYFNGDNKGAIVKCNTFNDMSIDLYNNGLDMVFGSSANEAHNTFSTNVASSHIYNVAGNTIKYYWNTIPHKPVRNIGPGAGAISPYAAGSEGCPNLNCHSWPVGVGEEITKELTSVYPNPVTNVLTVNFTKKNKIYIIYDASGRIIYKQAITQDREQIDVSNWPEGMYYIKVDSTDGIRFVVVR